VVAGGCGPWLVAGGCVDRPKLQAGSWVEFQLDAQGHLTMRPRNVDVRRLKGIIRSRRKMPVSIEEMNEAIARGWSGT